jgi:spore maturation protein CgeB
MSKLEVFALVAPGETGLLGSYARAYEAIGCRVTWWDPYSALHRHTRLGAVGRYISRFMPVDAWLHKANREMFVAALDRAPDLVIVSGNTPVRAGALAQLRIASPQTRIVLLWPDPLLNLSRHVIESLPVYDLVATYSQASIEELGRLGARNAQWVPFAADPLLFPSDSPLDEADRRTFGCDVAFVGSHRPEREAAIQSLLRAGFTVKVWGDDSWRRHATDRSTVAAYYRGRPLWGVEFAKAVRCAKLSLNPIDPTNFPAANMRFFESAACGAATLNSRCPEVEAMFPNGDAAFYYDSLQTLPERVRQLLDDPAARAHVANAGHERVIRNHTYADRARQIARAVDKGHLVS